MSVSFVIGCSHRGSLPRHAFPSSCPLIPLHRVSLRTSFLVPIQFPVPIKSRWRYTCTRTELPPQSNSQFQSSSPRPPNPSRQRLRTPYDLVLFRKSLFSSHLSELRRRNKLPPYIVPDTPSLLDGALSRAGQAHERRAIQHILDLITSANPSLREEQIVYHVPFASPERYSLTESAILRRTPLIIGAALRDHTFTGYADMLILNSLDPFQRTALIPEQEASYTVCEIKLSSTQRPDYAIQAAVYNALLSAMISHMNLVVSKRTYVWLGPPEKPPTSIPSRTLHYLYRRTSHDFHAFLEAFDESAPVPLPDAPTDKLSPWSTYAEKQLEDRDSLLLVAGITRAQAAEIEAVTNVNTLREFAEMSAEDVSHCIKAASASLTLKKLHKQAQMQYATRLNGGSPTSYELVKPESKLFVLPSASPAEMYFDMEGFPLMPDGGLEYLFGVKMASSTNFNFWWAHNREQEERAFVGVMNWIQEVFNGEREAGRPQPHIFHYGHYEVTALRRIGTRVTSDAGHAAAQYFESLVEDNRFIDIYKVVKSEIVVGEPSYSIKKVEKLVGVSREGDELADAESSVGMYYEWREQFFPESDAEVGIPPLETGDEILDDILKYNRQDCESLQEVVSWLRDKLPCGDITEEPTETASAEGDDEQETEAKLLPGACGATYDLKVKDSACIQRSIDLSAMLLQHNRKMNAQVRQTLSNLLHFYVLESAPVRREFYERVKLAYRSNFDALREDDECLTSIRLIGTTTAPSAGKRAPKTMYKYLFSMQQPCVLSSDSSVAFVAPCANNALNSGDANMISSFMTVKSIDSAAENGMGIVTLSAGRKSNFTPPKFGCLISSDGLSICSGPLRQSVLRSAERLVNDSSDEKVSLIEAFLRRKAVNEEYIDGDLEHLFQTGDALPENLTEFLASRRESCALVIQGPPGSGKTYLSGKVISQLVMQHGKKVAVSSNSHAAIDNLLSACIGSGVTKDVAWKLGTASMNKDCKLKRSINDLHIQDNNGGVLVGATCYQLSREQAEGLFDYLFIDEASQVPTANFIAMAGCAHYAVLTGDQQQLEMPIRGAHIGASGTSCLSYIVRDSITVPIEHGLFLEVSYRMHPNICSFISDAFYDGALSAATRCTGNELLAPSDAHLVRAGAGISFLGSETIGDGSDGARLGTHHDAAEVAVVQRVMDELLRCSVRVHGCATRALQWEDVLIVAPYNAQVGAISTAMPRARVGTVDRFQGAQAAVVVISTCTSAEDEVADANERRVRKGLRFALRENRINVAVSRAQCAAIVVGRAEACRRMSMMDFEDVRLVALYERLQGEHAV